MSSSDPPDSADRKPPRRKPPRPRPRSKGKTEIIEEPAATPPSQGNVEMPHAGAVGAARRANRAATDPYDMLEDSLVPGVDPASVHSVVDSAPSSTPMLQRHDRDLRGIVLADRYKLNYELGRGGMGQVFVGEHLTLKTPVAVKVMLPGVAARTDYVRRFQREARAMSLLNHRNIVHVMDYGVQQGMPFIVMEYLTGRSLSEWLYYLGELPTLADVADVLRQLLDAFAAAHNAGIVHRDLKPDNIFLATEADGKRVVKVLDFGLARIDDARGKASTLTNVDSVSGTPEYMSPEQCRSLAVAPAADLYAIGCVLTEMLQGYPPFDGPSHADIMTKQMFVAPPPLDRPAGGEAIPPLLERLRRDLLAKRPERRPADVEEIRNRLDEALSADRAAQRLPARKGPMALGHRNARQQDWTNPEPPRVQPSTNVAGVRIGLLRFGDSEHGVDDTCRVGLAAGGLNVLTMEADVDPTLAGAVIVDAGEHLDAAASWLQQARANIKRRGKPMPLVCVDRVDAQRLNRLIAAGAGDVVVYPVEVVALVRKLRRLLRRARRSTRDR